MQITQPMITKINQLHPTPNQLSSRRAAHNLTTMSD
jgi:hypothetical protein